MTDLLTTWEKRAQEIERNPNRSEADGAEMDTLRECAEEVRGLEERLDAKAEALRDTEAARQQSVPEHSGVEKAVEAVAKAFYEFRNQFKRWEAENDEVRANYREIARNLLRRIQPFLAQPSAAVQAEIAAVAKQLWHDSQRDTTIIRDAGYMQAAAERLEALDFAASPQPENSGGGRETLRQIGLVVDAALQPVPAQEPGTYFRKIRELIGEAASLQSSGGVEEGELSVTRRLEIGSALEEAFAEECELFDGLGDPVENWDFVASVAIGAVTPFFTQPASPQPHLSDEDRELVEEMVRHYEVQTSYPTTKGDQERARKKVGLLRKLASQPEGSR